MTATQSDSSKQVLTTHYTTQYLELNWWSADQSGLTDWLEQWLAGEAEYQIKGNWPLTCSACRTDQWTPLPSSPSCLAVVWPQQSQPAIPLPTPPRRSLWDNLSFSSPATFRVWSQSVQSVQCGAKCKDIPVPPSTFQSSLAWPGSPAVLISGVKVVKRRIMTRWWITVSMFPPDSPHSSSTKLQSSQQVFILSLPAHQLLGEQVVVVVVGVQPAVPAVPLGRHERSAGPTVAGSVLLPGLLSTLSLLIPP